MISTKSAGFRDAPPIRPPSRRRKVRFVPFPAKAENFTHFLAPPLHSKPASLGFALGAACGGHCGRIGVHPSRTLCHGWSEPGAAVKWHRPKFCTASGPSGPEGIIPGTVFCAPEILHEGIGVSPVNGGPGENELEPEGTCSRRRCESPPAILWFLSHRWERNSPCGAKSSAWNETHPKTGGRVRRSARPPALLFFA